MIEENSCLIKLLNLYLKSVTTGRSERAPAFFGEARAVKIQDPTSSVHLNAEYTFSDGYCLYFCPDCFSNSAPSFIPMCAKNSSEGQEAFTHDVFLSHSSLDKAIVRRLAVRLRDDGLRVWYDEWEIKPGDSIPSKIEEGLECSRIMILCMSKNSFGSDWARLEAGTFRFRDPLNKARRFIPLKLDTTPIKGTLAQFLYIEWSSENQSANYSRLLAACKPVTKLVAAPSGSGGKKRSIQLKVDHPIIAYAFNPAGKYVISGGQNTTPTKWSIETGQCIKAGGGKRQIYTSIMWSKGGSTFLSGSDDKRVRLWDAETMRCKRVFIGHTGTVQAVGWGALEQYVVSGSSDGSIRLWNTATGKCLQVFYGHEDPVRCLAISHDGRYILSGSSDKTIRLWDMESFGSNESEERVFRGHSDSVHCVAWSEDNSTFLSGSADKTMRLWDVGSGRCIRVFEGHTGPIRSIAWKKKEGLALSGSWDRSVRVWDVEKGRCISVLKENNASIYSVDWIDGSHALSGNVTGGINIWELDAFIPRIREVSRKLNESMVEQVYYTNAKVLLVGDSGVGKSGLCQVLANGRYIDDSKPLASTDGAWATHWPLQHADIKSRVEREIWLWDFAGQVDYRLVHQLFMEDTSAAVLVFNPQNENPFAGIGQWDRDLQKASTKSFAKLLVAGRIDRGGVVVSSASIDKFMRDRGFLLPLHLTSAKTGEGCDGLKSAIINAIDWQGIPETTSPALYRRLKQEILGLRDEGLVLIRFSELKQRLDMKLQEDDFEIQELEAVIGLLTGPGMIQRLDFGGFILLRPEVLSRYAAAVVRKIRQHPQELGCIREDEFLKGDLDYQDFKRLPREDEVVVLSALLETFVSRAWCLRQSCDDTAILTFPSYFRRERKEQPSHPSVLVTYRFDGPVEDIYATLVVRLHHTKSFDSVDLWKAAADFKTQAGGKLGFTLISESEGTSRIEVYFERDVDRSAQVLFLRYIHEHLVQHAQNVVRLRQYFCSSKKCDSSGQPFADHEKIAKALAPGGRGKVFCPDCGTKIVLRDVIEERFESPLIKEGVRANKEISSLKIDNESRELLAVHHTGFIVAEAGQIFRPTPNSDHGIDGEIEFKDDLGRASGRRVYVQLKSGDSYLKERRSDGVETFQIKKAYWAEYWQQQGWPVMLVIRTSDGEIRWMNITDYLRREMVAGAQVKQVVFDGERLDVLSVLRWRKHILASTV